MTVFVTPHAAQAYRQRIHGDRTAEQARADITEALRRPLFRCAAKWGNVTLWGCQLRGRRLVVATDPADEGAEFLLVRTIGPPWFWRETRPYWRQHGAD